MSISLVIDGELWGLIACHHYSGPHRPSQDARAAAEFLGQVASQQIAERSRSDARERAPADAIATLGRIVGRVAAPTASALDALIDDPELLDADGRHRRRPCATTASAARWGRAADPEVARARRPGPARARGRVDGLHRPARRARPERWRRTTTLPAGALVDRDAARPLDGLVPPGAGADRRLGRRPAQQAAGRPPRDRRSGSRRASRSTSGARSCAAAAGPGSRGRPRRPQLLRSQVNGLLLKRSRDQIEVAESLQRSVLADGAPTLDGLDVAVRYTSAASYQLGGDWWDWLELDERPGRLRHRRRRRARRVRGGRHDAGPRGAARLPLRRHARGPQPRPARPVHGRAARATRSPPRWSRWSTGPPGASRWPAPATRRRCCCRPTRRDRCGRSPDRSSASAPATPRPPRSTSRPAPPCCSTPTASSSVAATDLFESLGLLAGRRRQRPGDRAPRSLGRPHPRRASRAG